MTDGPFFQKNLDALRQLNPEQAETIASLSPKVFNRLYAVSELKNGFSAFSIKSSPSDLVPLFRTAEPELEIQGWIQSITKDADPFHAVFLLGFGLGYEARRILDILPHNGILAIVEPDPFQFFTAMHYVDLTVLLSSNRVHFYVGQSVDKTVESIGAELQWGRFLNLPYRILITPFMRRLRPEFPKQFTVSWRDAMQRELMYRRSRVEHGETVVINTISNAEAILGCPGVSTLFYQFEGLPAVLAAAGPSLEKSVNALRDLQNRVLIACVNTAYPILRKNGIRPHIVFTMDHNERNILSFENDTPSPETYLIADPRIQPRIVRHFYPRVFLASWRATTETLGKPAPLEEIPVPKMSGNAIYLWLQSLAGGKGDVYGPGSVAVVGFHILARLGCKPIILAGQDLAFTDQKAYAAGTIFDDKSLPQDANAAHEVPSVNGGTVGTSETLHLYRKLLEHEIARFKIPVFNTSSGALINGSITSRVESLFDELPQRGVDVAERLAELHKSYVPRADAIDLRRAIQSALLKLQEFADCAKESLEIVPLDPELTLNDSERRTLLSRLEKVVATCTNGHKEAIELLNELLQETHFEFEDSRWRTYKESDEKKVLNEKIRNHARILDAFIKQTGLLSFLFEEKLEKLD